MLRQVKAWCTAYSLISLYQLITTNYMIMNLIDLKRPPIVCIEAAVRNGGQALRSIMRVRKWHYTQTICRYLSSNVDEEHENAWKQCPVLTRYRQYIHEYVISCFLLP